MQPNKLSDLQCEDFLRSPTSMFDILRAAHDAGFKAGLEHASLHGSERVEVPANGLLLLDLKNQSRAVGGMPVTLKQRQRVHEMFARFCRKENISITTTQEITTELVSRFLGCLPDISDRTKANYLSALAVVIRQSGNPDVAKELTAKRFAANINKATSSLDRTPKRQVLSQMEYENYIALAKEKDEGAAMVLMLCAEFGLWQREAVMANEKVLAVWYKKLRAGQPIVVFNGARCGRKRNAVPANFERALLLIKHARKIASKNDGRLVGGENVDRAMHQLQRVFLKIGLTGKHTAISFRFQYAVARFRQLISDGMSPEEAATEVRCDMTHGGGEPCSNSLIKGLMLTTKAKLESATPT